MRVMFLHEKPFSRPGDSPSDEDAARGGLRTYMEMLSGALVARGCSLSSVRFIPGLRSARQVSESAWVLPASSVRPGRATPRELLRILDSAAPDMVHMHSVFYAMNPTSVRAVTKTSPTVYTLHEASPLCFWRTKVMRDGSLCEHAVGFRCLTRGCYTPGASTPFARDVARMVATGPHLAEYRRLPTMIVPSRYLRAQLLVNGFRPDRVRVIPHPSPYASEPLVAVTRPSRILFAGRLTREKGLLEMIEALALLRTPSWEAVIVGVGEQATWRSMAEARGIAHRLRWVGSVPLATLREHYRDAAIVVFPSMAPESFGFVGVEAMSLGRPVVAFVAGGVEEWLEDGVTGLAVRHGDVPHLASQLDRLLGDAALRERLGAAAHEAARTRFRLDAHVDSVLALYRERIEAGRHAS